MSTPSRSCTFFSAGEALKFLGEDDNTPASRKELPIDRMISELSTKVYQAIKHDYQAFFQPSDVLKKEANKIWKSKAITVLQSVKKAVAVSLLFGSTIWNLLAGVFLLASLPIYAVSKFIGGSSWADR